MQGRKYNHFYKKCIGNSSTQLTSFYHHGAVPALQNSTWIKIDYHTFTTDLELRIEWYKF